MGIENNVTHLMFLIFVGAATLSTFALFTRQSLLVAYIVIGAILGPWGLKFVNNSEAISQAGDIGIIFLLFLLGLELQPQSLFHSLRKMSMITVISSLLFFAIGYIPSFLFGYGAVESLLIGIAAMFSSTIIGIKLLPTTVLHHQHTGELAISILLLQDVLAIISIFAVHVIADRGSAHNVWLVITAFPLLFLIAYVFERYVLAWLMEHFDQIHEYLFILSIGWCLCMAELAHKVGLSSEVGAFIAGVALASHPIAAYVAESLKPLRDFFLVIFFFAIGASFNFSYFHQVIIPAVTLAGLVLILKPIIFSQLLRYSGEVKRVGWEIGVRLGQLSEFSLLLNYIALESKLVQPTIAYTIQAAVIITFFVSSYWIVMRYQTPLASNDRLRRN